MCSVSGSLGGRVPCFYTSTGSLPVGPSTRESEYKEHAIPPALFASLRGRSFNVSVVGPVRLLLFELAMEDLGHLRRRREPNRRVGGLAIIAVRVSTEVRKALNSPPVRIQARNLARQVSGEQAIHSSREAKRQVSKTAAMHPP